MQLYKFWLGDTFEKMRNEKLQIILSLVKSKNRFRETMKALNRSKSVWKKFFKQCAMKN